MNVADLKTVLKYSLMLGYSCHLSKILYVFQSVLIMIMLVRQNCIGFVGMHVIYGLNSHYLVTLYSLFSLIHTLHIKTCKRSSTFDNLKKKAKKSLTSSFENINDKPHLFILDCIQDLPLFICKRRGKPEQQIVVNWQCIHYQSILNWNFCCFFFFFHIYCTTLLLHLLQYNFIILSKHLKDLPLIRGGVREVSSSSSLSSESISLCVQMANSFQDLERKLLSEAICSLTLSLLLYANRHHKQTSIIFSPQLVIITLPARNTNENIVQSSNERDFVSKFKKKKKKKKREGNPPPFGLFNPSTGLFMKVGNQGKSQTLDTNCPVTPKKGSWRQAIFNRVVTPVKPNSNLQDVPKTPDASLSGTVRAPLTKENIRALWRKVILQQITLIRMEKENKKLQAQQDASCSKRMKLDYEEITPCLKEVTKVWDELLSREQSQIFRKTEVLKAVKDGIPRHKRGDIWIFLANQNALKNPAPVGDIDTTLPYRDLLKDLTSHQHAILIDLGRTFPSHPYYARPLGPGQLGLFNLLKAYSLLDKDVGYCQGLSFVAGVLLLHMEEENAFNMMKHLMFNIGIRRQYKPDMVALQVQMYQLSRLIHDYHRDLYEHFEMHDIAPTLYAAPWFLTLFASQFPLGFVSRLFDILLLQDFEVIFKVALILLGNHKELIMQCNGFEAIMEFLKTTLPSLGIIQMERVFNQVFTLVISKQLHAFEVEYHVLQEEMIVSPQKTEAAYQNLRRQNMELVEQLQLAHANIYNLEHSIGSYQETINKLQAQVKALELEKSGLQRSVMKMQQDNPNLQRNLEYERQSATKIKENYLSTASEFRQGSNDSSSYDDEDNEVAMTFQNNSSSNGNIHNGHVCLTTDSPGAEK
ncbi:TBC1 domain family member 1 [Nymphon striatum]|nr:TBC1 domain family member 1 [Nymphon striatum]